jgi:hypothetical protein
MVLRSPYWGEGGEIQWQLRSISSIWYRYLNWYWQWYQAEMEPLVLSRIRAYFWVKLLNPQVPGSTTYWCGTLVGLEPSTPTGTSVPTGEAHLTLDTSTIYLSDS